MTSCGERGCSELRPKKMSPTDCNKRIGNVILRRDQDIDYNRQLSIKCFNVINLNYLN
jgi:hypothetical protein